MIFRAAYTRRLTASISAYVIETEFSGSQRSEFSYIQIARSTIIGAHINF